MILNRVVGEPCPYCRQRVESYDDCISCSDFCASATKQELERYRNQQMAVGDWGVYPCEGCGGALEGEWHQPFRCQNCALQARLDRRRELLEQAAKLLESVAKTKSPTTIAVHRQRARELIQAIKEALQ